MSFMVQSQSNTDEWRGMSDSMSDPGVLVLRPSKLKWIIIATGGLIFVALAVWLAAQTGEFPAYVGMLFFGLVTGIALINIFTELSSLTLQADGFVTKSLGRSYFTAWKGCTKFKAGRIASRKVVTFELVSEQGGAVAGQPAAGTPAALPDTYGRTAEGLAELMNDWRDRAMEAA